MVILLFTPTISPRIRYIAEYIFHDYLQIDCQLTDSVEEFKACDSMKLSYASQPIGNELFVWQHPLLLQTSVEPQSISILKFNKLPAFFGCEHPQAVFPFDLFAASFYLISRYEEYLPHTPDRFGRFSAKNSLAVNENFLQKPLVNIWAKWLGEKLRERFPQIQIPLRKFDYIPTYDIDQPYAHLYRGIIVNSGGIVKSLLHRHFRESKERLLTLIRHKKDKYDTYGFQFALQKKYGFKPYYFVLCATVKSKYDRVLSINNKKIIALINRLSKYGHVGIHPSFASDSDARKIGAEIKLLSSVLQNSVIYSRQHYLLLKMPQTYQALLSHRIKADFTMGYASRPGFRASVCTPFHFFDLTKNESTSLTIYPLAYMDGTLNYYMELSRLDAQLLIKDLVNEVKAVNGLFISLWHNSSLSDSGRWRGWRAVYKYTLDYADSMCDKPEEII